MSVQMEATEHAAEGHHGHGGHGHSHSHSHHSRRAASENREMKVRSLTPHWGHFGVLTFVNDGGINQGVLKRRMKELEGQFRSRFNTLRDLYEGRIRAIADEV